MKRINTILLFLKGSVCYNCRHYDICKFANKVKESSNPTTSCSNKQEEICKMKQEN